jgi:hypothetical protein
MNKNNFAVVVPNEYISKLTGNKGVAWNRVGRAWFSKSSESITFELYMFPDQRYVIHLLGKELAATFSEPATQKEE